MPDLEALAPQYYCLDDWGVPEVVGVAVAFCCADQATKCALSYHSTLELLFSGNCSPACRETLSCFPFTLFTPFKPKDMLALQREGEHDGATVLTRSTCIMFLKSFSIS